jgi:hypothetical protein
MLEDSPVSAIFQKRGRLLLVLVALLALSLVSATAVLAVATRLKGGAVNAVRTATGYDTHDSTTSTSWSDLPGMSATVRVASGANALLVITFSAVSQCHDYSTPIFLYCYVRATVDGVEAPPGAVVFNSAAAGTNTLWAWSACSG